MRYLLIMKDVSSDLGVKNCKSLQFLILVLHKCEFDLQCEI